MAQTKLRAAQVDVTGGGVTNWTEAYNSGTQATSSFLATGAGTNINAAIVAKGNGGIIASIPDGTSTGGNSRGQYAVDLQRARTGATKIAAGNYSVICGGNDNIARDAYACVIGGYGNDAFGSYSLVIGGSTNYAASESFAICGYANRAEGASAGVGGGQWNTAANDYSYILGGYYNRAAANHSWIGGGREAHTTIYGQHAHAAGQFGNLGSAQYSRLIARRSITGTAIAQLYADGSSVNLVLPSDGTYGLYTVWSARVQIVASVKTVGNGSCSVGDSWVSEHAVGIKNLNGTTSLIGTVQSLYTAQADTNMSSAVVTITADNTNDALKIEFTPPSTAGSTTVIQVVATISLTQTRY